jgi:hypothetical protein
MLEGKGTKGSEEFEDTKEVIRRLKSKDRAVLRFKHSDYLFGIFKLF